MAGVRAAADPHFNYIHLDIDNPVCPCAWWHHVVPVACRPNSVSFGSLRSNVGP